MDIVDLLYGSLEITEENDVVTIRCLNDDNEDSVLSIKTKDGYFEYYENTDIKSPSITFEYMDSDGEIHICLLFLTKDCRIITYGENSSDIVDLKLLVNKEVDPTNKEGRDDFFTYVVRRGTSYENTVSYLFSFNKFGEVIRKSSKPYKQIKLYDEYNLIRGERLEHFDLMSLDGTLQLERLEKIYISVKISDEEEDKKYVILDGITYDNMDYTFIVDTETGEIISFLDPSITPSFIKTIIERYKTKNPSVKDGNVITGIFRKN